MTKHLFHFALTALLVFILQGPAYANLLITPLQVTIEGRERSSQIILLNTSKSTNTYRIEWEQLEQVENAGGYIRSKNEGEALYLQDFAVYTPRQITLGPNEKQTVRVAIRRPAELEEGEYKSHLKFRIIAEEKPADLYGPKPGPDEIRVGARVLASYSIPVIYRVGEYDINISIDTPPAFSINPKTGFLIADIAVNRSGKHGVIGFVELYHTPRGGTETLIGGHGNANMFPEISTRAFSIPTQISGLAPGSIRVVFKKAEGQTNTHQVLFERNFPVTN